MKNRKNDETVPSTTDTSGYLSRFGFRIKRMAGAIDTCLFKESNHKIRCEREIFLIGLKVNNYKQDSYQ